MTEWRETSTAERIALVRERAEVPVVVLAIHAGHQVSSDIEPLYVITAEERLREEDPFTAGFAPADATLVEVTRSRFEVDLNRPRESCVYLAPQDAWGLEVWRERPSPDRIEQARRLHDDFYRELGGLLERTITRHGFAVVLDVHSYNHRRSGPQGAFADAGENPEVNLGARSIEGIARWEGVREAFLVTMRGHGFDVRENVKFGGGHLSRWIAAEFPFACPLAIEFKKTFMDEWTGEPDPEAMRRIQEAMTAVVPRLERALGEVGPA